MPADEQERLRLAEELEKQRLVVEQEKQRVAEAKRLAAKEQEKQRAAEEQRLAEELVVKLNSCLVRFPTHPNPSTQLIETLERKT